MKNDDKVFAPGKKARNGIYKSKKTERRNRQERIRRHRDPYDGFIGQLIERYETAGKVKRYTFLYIILPVFLVFVYECMGYKSLGGGFEFLIKHPWAYLCNVMILVTSFSLALLFKRRAGVILTMTLLWTLCAFANFILLCNRVTPFTGNDLALITDVFGVVGKYLTPVESVLVVLLIVAAIFGIIRVFQRAPLACKRVNYLKSLFTIAMTILLTWGTFLVSWQIGGVETQFHELSQSYKKNGFLYCFLNSLVDVGVKKPEDYSQEMIETLLDPDNEESKESIEQETDKTPNIIIVQLESFFDVNRLKDVTYSENPIPNFTRLMSENGSGLFSVPVIGAGTVNSEFEVLTGMNIDDFGAGEYPYKTILKKTTCETIAYNLKAHGYTAHAMHNHVGSFYSRNQIYSNMGFDTFTSLEYMWPNEYTPMNWAKDKVLTGEIARVLHSTDESDFVYAVSVQGHGSYPSDMETEYEHHIEVSSSVIEDEAYLNQLTYYVNQIYEMDQFVGELVEMLEECGEDTILVMYGDHMPSLDLSDEKLTGGTIYQTEYFIWNNMNLSFVKRDIEAYEVSSRILDALDIEDGVINSYHQNYLNQDAKHVITVDEYLEGLKELEYDILYGEQLCYEGVNPYVPTILQMGIEPITISGAEVVYDTESGAGTLKVQGDNFTRYSKVYVNGKAQDAWYVSSKVLKVPDITLEPGDEIVVWQRSLSSTEPYIFQKEFMETEPESTEQESETQTEES